MIFIYKYICTDNFYYSQNVVEDDNLIFFNDRYISSILKPYGKQLYEVYELLSAEEQLICGFCLNGILDLSNQKECSQKKLFTNDQWDYLIKHLGSKKMKYLPNLSDATKKKVEKIIKEIKSGQEEEAYYITIESIRGAHSADKWIFKVLSHIINAYRERTNIFTNPTNKISELDFLMKLWGEVLELLVGDSFELYVNWGETSTDTMAAVKRINNDNKPHTVGCKVDGRIVCKVSKVVDTCHVEAARASSML
ncbi:uncharacterized protein BX663DRAFT_501980 [Cokeromyces recurvatus]|uniref:uncharacterized protein n=1 Tax=Cokeromyces recurvatus TaxID=90255 RepID=UPI0022205542|nr:uncharacterized protein BX663DRAFT_501980 [Cokeromyces recurvatus]KAI7905179.1 hypothetical protein BX663DRAFT_501980 [Cokeromyces recurvatus]